MTNRYCEVCKRPILNAHGNRKYHVECKHLRDLKARHERHMRNAADPAYRARIAERQRLYDATHPLRNKVIHSYKKCPRCHNNCRTIAKRCSNCGHTLDKARIVLGKRQQPEHGMVAGIIKRREA